MRLRRNQYCPLHRSLSSCGREPVPNKLRQIRLGVQRIEDPHHPRGYRELRSPAEMRKLLNRKIVEQNRRAGCPGDGRQGSQALLSSRHPVLLPETCRSRNTLRSAQRQPG